MEKQKLELGHFAELARMLKYIDRLDEQEIVMTIKQEGEKEMQKAQEQLEHVNKLIAETTGETVEPIVVETNVKNYDYDYDDDMQR